MFIFVIQKYASCLCSVDLSSCRGITSDAIKYLVSLCGPQLIHLNLAMTQVSECPAQMVVTKTCTQKQNPFVYMWPSNVPKKRNIIL